MRLWLDHWLGRLEHLFWRLLMLLPYRGVASRESAPDSAPEAAAPEPARPVKTMIRPEPAAVPVPAPRHRPMAIPLDPRYLRTQREAETASAPTPAMAAAPQPQPETRTQESAPEAVASGMSTVTFILLITFGLAVVIGSFFV
ncbi:MAG: hypothetical protein KDI44_15440 [Thiothrix sp.]|nr:hypothetical protein [Thiothrix sp.]HPQ94251.1 hypothetical protein [Thiolinea sp.]